MKRYILYMIGVLLFGAWTTACTDEMDEKSSAQGDSGVTFTLHLTNHTLTTRAVAAPEAGESAYHENDIVSATCFFYPTGKTGDNAVYSVTYSPEQAQDGTATVTVKVPNDKVRALFGDAGTTCHAYVIANYPTTLSAGGTSIAELKRTTVETDFTEAQTSFVMDGESDRITLDRDKNTISGNVNLYRAASKIALFITSVEDEVEDESDGKPWRSNKEGMKVQFYKGVKKSRVDVGVNGNDLASGNYFNSEGNGAKGLRADKDADGNFLHYKHDPFYSYSSDWGEESDPDEEAYMILVVPWQKEGSSTWQSCYYQIPVNVADKKLMRNTYYKVKLTVSKLGSFVPEEPVELNPSYIIVDWGNGSVDVNIKDYRYLVVDQNNVVINNKPSVEIPFTTSHGVTVEITSITKPDYSKNIASTSTIYDKVKNIGSKSGFEFTPNDNNTILSFAHILKNDNSTYSDYDYVPYTIIAKVYHTDNDKFSEEIKLIQYPAMYVEAYLNSNYEDSRDNSKIGYVWVNNSRSTYGNVNGMNGSAKNANPNMYVIKLSAFSNSSSFIIGDPRSLNETDLNNSSSWSSTTAIYDGPKRKLKYYYPTNSSDDAQNIIAPKFRIASSYGVTSAIGFDTAQKRCASYQEDGYPAGRWRIPTTAEIKYIVQISAEGKIPKLFNDGGNYWAANNKNYVPNHSTGTVGDGEASSAYVRCVYDEWYWTDRVTRTTFTWGDAPR